MVSYIQPLQVSFLTPLWSGSCVGALSEYVLRIHVSQQLFLSIHVRSLMPNKHAVQHENGKAPVAGTECVP